PPAGFVEGLLPSARRVDPACEGDDAGDMEPILLEGAPNGFQRSARALKGGQIVAPKLDPAITGAGRGLDLLHKPGRADGAGVQAEHPGHAERPHSDALFGGLWDSPARPAKRRVVK